MANLALAKSLSASAGKPNWPVPVKYLGGGANGRVYETNDGRLMKFVFSNAPKEYQILNRLQGTFIVPRFRRGDGVTLQLDPIGARVVKIAMFPKANLSKDITIFVMGRVGNANSMTLHKYIKEYAPRNTNVQRRVEYLVEQLAIRGVSHGDLHTGNIIVSVTPSGRISGMWVVDFGRSHVMMRRKTERETMGRIPRAYRSRTPSVFGGGARPVSVREGSRANVNMMEVMYGKRLSPAWERRMANIRTQVREEMQQYKSPGRRVPKSKSLSLGRARSAPRMRSSRSASRVSP